MNFQDGMWVLASSNLRTFVCRVPPKRGLGCPALGEAGRRRGGESVSGPLFHLFKEAYGRGEGLPLVDSMAIGLVALGVELRYNCIRSYIYGASRENLLQFLRSV